MNCYQLTSCSAFHRIKSKHLGLVNHWQTNLETRSKFLLLIIIICNIFACRKYYKNVSNFKLGTTSAFSWNNFPWLWCSQMRCSHAVYRYLKISELFPPLLALQGKGISFQLQLRLMWSIPFLLLKQITIGYPCPFKTSASTVPLLNNSHVQQNVLVLLASVVVLFLNLFGVIKILILWTTANYITVICSSIWKKREFSGLQPSDLNTSRSSINMAPDPTLSYGFGGGRTPNEL